MLDTWLIKAENAYRSSLNLKEEETSMIDEKLIDTKDWEEHYVRKGDPNKPTYYIIRRRISNDNFFSNFIVCVGHIRYALSNDWIPVVDMQNYPNALLEPKKLGKENAWEYFFEQPLRIGLEQAYNGENIILSKDGQGILDYTRTPTYDNKNVELAQWRLLVKKGLIKIKPEIMEEIITTQAKLFTPTDRVLSVRLRDTDHFANKPRGVPIPPPIEYARDVILEKVRTWKCDKIFLSTEDKNIVQFFKDTFGDDFGTFCVTIEKEYVDYKPGQSLNNLHVNRENDRFLSAKEQLTEIVILSKGNSFITARCPEASCVMMLSENFENVYAFNLSKYGVHFVDYRKFIGQFNFIERRLISDGNWEEHYLKMGNPKKPTYYMIRPRYLDSGLFYNVVISLGYIKYALTKGWIPVIDMQNYPNPNLSPEKLGKENSWEYYFEQPLRVGIEEAYNAENLVRCGYAAKPRPDITMSFYENVNNTLTKWRMMVELGLLKVKQELVEEAIATQKKLFAPTDRVLGVYLRGTDYLSFKLYGHPVPPPPEYAAGIVNLKLKEWNCNKIFLSTEDKNIVQFFKDAFGELCVTIDREYVDYNDQKKLITKYQIDRENDAYLQGKEYLMEILLLTMCTSFVTARSFGSVGVMMLGKGFENTYVFNLGRYGMRDLN